MIDVKDKDKRRRSKRKFHEAVGENGCFVQPKETILDMSVSKLAKAKTKVNLEPSLRKTVMIVNTIRKIEQEIESGKALIADEVICLDTSKGTCPDTRPISDRVATLGDTKNCAVLPVHFSLSAETESDPFVCDNNSERLDSRWQNRGESVGKPEAQDFEETLIDLSQTSSNFRNRLLGKCSSTGITSLPVSGDLPDVDEEINFGEIDISLYDFDETVAWSDGGLQIACGELEDNENVYKAGSTGLSALIRRCSDDLKFSKTTDSSFTDDLDQIMQVLVGI